MPSYRLHINRADSSAETRDFHAATPEDAVRSARTQMGDYTTEDMAVLTDGHGNPLTPLRGR